MLGLPGSAALRGLAGRRIERGDRMLGESRAAQIIRRRLDGELPSMRCVGYRQVWEMLEGRLPAAEMPDRGIFATRQLAKRQLTWLRGLDEAGHVDIQVDFADLPTTAKIRGQIEQHLAAASARSA